MLEIKSFYKEYEDMFEEYLEDVKRILRKKNQKYIKLQEKYHKILDENENLVWILEGQTENRNLSNKECITLAKLVQIYYNMQSIEEKEIFFLGCKEAYFLFKKIGVLKWVLSRFLEYASNVFVLTHANTHKNGTSPKPK